MIPPHARLRWLAPRPRSVTLLLGVAIAGCSTTLQGGATADAPRIAEVSVVGNERVDEDDIVDGLANRGPEGLFRRIYRRLDRLALEQDIARIEAYYQRRGFFSAKVVGTKIEPDGKDVRVTFRVTEGEPTKVSGLSVIGLSALLRRSKLLDLKEGPLQPGEVFRYDHYADFKAWISGWMAHRGYPHAQIDGKVEVDRDAHTADIRIVVDAGRLTRFGDTEVTGLSRVPKSAVLNRLAWKKGQRFDSELLELTQGRLYQLGFFGNVRMDYEKEGRPKNSDIQISVAEARPVELRLGGGVALGGGFSTENLRIQARQRTDFLVRGIFDPLTRLRVEARPAWEWDLKAKTNGPTGEATATLDRADLFLPRMTGSITGGYQRDEFDAYGSYGPLLRMNLTRAFLKDKLQIGVGWRLRYHTFFGESAAVDGDIMSEDEAEARTALQLDADPYRLAAYDQVVSYDLRDQPLDARRGVFAALSLSEGGSGAGGTLRFVRATADLRGYLPIGRRLVLAGRGLYGRALGDDDLPITERFFDGGASGHRGFGYRRLSPFVVSAGDDPERASVGGDESFLGSGEVRLDVGQLLKYPFAVVGFADAGDVVCQSAALHCSGNDRIDFADLHWAAGFGVRWTPVIAVRLDVGYRLNRTGDDEPDPAPRWFDRFAFQVSLGQAF